MTAMRERERSGELQPIRNVRSRALALKCVPKTSENATDAGWLRNKRSPARVTLRSVSNTSSVDPLCTDGPARRLAELSGARHASAVTARAQRFRFRLTTLPPRG